MRKTLWMPALTAAALAVSITAIWAIAQPDATTRPVGTAGASTQAMPTTQEILTQASYAVGFDIGKNMKEVEFQIDVANFTAGLEDALGGRASKLTDEQVQTAMGVLQQMMMERAQAKQEELLTKNTADGAAFLAANKSKPNVKTTASGLQYEITTEGSGPFPKASDTVRVHYTGTLIDGTKFDSSIDRGEPIEIPLDGVIPGWTEGIQLFKVGSKGKLYIPGELGYGARGSRTIPPNSTLIFDIEVLGIMAPTTQPTMEPSMEPMPTTVPTEMPTAAPDAAPQPTTLPAPIP